MSLPKNPINEERKEKIQEAAKKVAETFGKNYLLCFKDVMIERAIKKRTKKEAKEAKKAAKEAEAEERGERPDIPSRPRDWKHGKNEKVRKDELQVEIVSWEELNSDVDPFVVYVINSNLGDETATVYRRFSDFKKLHKKVGKKAKAKLPPASSKFGKRNLEIEFLRERKKTLGAYLNALAKDEKTADSDSLQEWLGLGGDKDKVLDETFVRAFKRTRWDLWNWRKIVWDKEEDALAQLVVAEVWRDIGYDIQADLPDNSKLRKQAMKGVHKSINAVGQPAVKAAYAGAKKAVDAIKDPVKKTLKDALAQLLEIRAQIKAKLTDVMSGAIQPVIDVLNDLVADLLSSLAPAFLDGIAEHASKRQEITKELEEVILSGDLEAMKALESKVSDTKEEVYKSIDKKMQDSLEGILGKHKDKISLEALKSVLSPIEHICNIIEGFFEVIDPRNQFHVLKALVEHKKTIADSSPTDLSRTLDREEWDIRAWKIWRSNWEMRHAGWKVAYNIRREFPSLSPIADAFMDFVYEAVEVNRKALKKFSWRFGDHLWHHASEMKDEENTAAYHEAIDKAFLFGYEECVYYAQSRTKDVGRNFLRGILWKSVGGPIQREVIPKVEGALDPIESEIPDGFKDILSISSLVTESIDDTLNGAIDNILDSFLGNVAQEAAARGIIGE